MEKRNFFEEFLNDNPDIAKKINGIKTDPMVEMVDSALQMWMSKERDTLFEFTPERRELLIKIVKEAVKYSDIQDSPFYQYVRAYIVHLFYWLVSNQEQEVEMGGRLEVDHWECFDEVMAETFIMGFVMGKEKPLEEGAKF